MSALLAGSQGVVDSFEPDAANAALLRVNALLAQQIFPESSPIRICASAVVSDRPGLSRLYRSDRNPSEHTLLPTPDAIQTLVVPSTSLDDWRFHAEADLRPVCALAIDIVGGELAVVEGAERLLQQDRPVLIVRLRAAASGIDACCQLIDRLATWGYRRLRLARPVAPEPYVLLSDSLRLFAAAELADHLRRKIVGPDLTLVAHSVPHS